MLQLLAKLKHQQIRNMQFKTAYMAVEIAQFLQQRKESVYIKLLEGGVAKDSSCMQNRKSATSDTFMSTLFHKRQMIQEYGV